MKIRDGRRFVVKPIYQVWSGRQFVNVEAELLAARLFRRARVRSPDVAVIEWPGANGPHVGSRFVAGTATISGRSDPLLRRSDLDALCRLLVVDLIIGNTDRHLGNVLFTRSRRGEKATPIAIDHALSMVTDLVLADAPVIQHFTATFDGLRPPAGATLWERTVAARRGTVPSIWKSTCLTGLVASIGPDRIRAQVDGVRRSLTEAVVRPLVRELPDGAVYDRNVRARKREIEAILLSRRSAATADRLIAYFATAAAGTGEAAGV